MTGSLIERAAAMSQLKLEKQFEAANFSDQRSMNFAGIQIAVAAILCGLAQSSPAPIAMLFGAAALLFSAYLAWYSVLPSKFNVAGAKYSDFAQDIEAGENLEAVYSQIGAYTDEMIDENNAQRREYNGYFKLSFLVAVWSLFFTVLTQGIWLVKG